MRILAVGGPKMLVGVTKSGFLAVSIPYISDGYLNSFRYAVFSACPSMCSNTSFPRLNFLFMLTWKSKVAKLFVTVVL